MSKLLKFQLTVVPQSQRTLSICDMDSSSSIAGGARERNLRTPASALPGGATRSRRKTGWLYARIWRAKHLPGGSHWKVRRIADQELTPRSHPLFIWRTTLEQSAKSIDRFAAPRHAPSLGQIGSRTTVSR